MDYKFPNDLKYTSTHEWIKIKEDIAVIGITDYAQHQLGDIVFIELPKVGLIYERESNVAEIESVKAVGDLLMPLSGEIITVNEKLSDNPELVNSSPYEEGWILKVNISHSNEINDLLTVENYKELVESEEK